LFATLGPKPVILAVALIFVIAAAVLFALRVPKDRAAPSEGTWVAEMTAGARHIAGTPVLRQVTIAATAAMIAFGMAQTLLFVVVDQGLHQPDAFVAILISAQGAGAIAAGACAAGIARWLGDSILVGLGLSSTALGLLLETLPSIPTALAGAVVVGASSAWIGIGAMTLFQRRTPSELMGRVDAALGLAFFAPQTVAIGVGATLITAVDYRILLLALVATTALAAAYLLSRPGPIAR
jgi:Na+/melibiose symporter-like transporter